MRDDTRKTRALAETWLRYARSDEENASALLDDHGGNAAGVCFLSQQMAEKYLKALLVAWTGEYERTHDFDLLLTLLEPHATGIGAALQKHTLVLEPYYIGTRYPADLPIESLIWRDADEAFAAALAIKKFVLKQLEGSNDTHPEA